MNGDHEPARAGMAMGRPRCGNRLLDTLSDADFARIERHLEPVELPAGRVLFEPGDDVSHACFPCDGAAVALVAVMTDGRSAEAAVIGCEGAVGVIISAGDKPAFTRAVVQMPGSGLRLEASRIEQLKLDSPRARDLISRYADALLAQVLQSVACNALHPVEARACRWLLSLQDRAGTAALPLTQERLAELLGVRRTTVTRVIADLEAAGIIDHSRGRVRVASRAKLERNACECYRAVRDHFRRVAPGLYPEPQDICE
jgi:CRP-like cAMP-binding protein